MDGKEYLNEERYQKNNDKVRKVGKILLIIGLIILAIGILLVVLSFVGIGKAASNSFSVFESDSFGISDAKNATDGFLGNIGLLALGAFLNTIGFGLTIAGIISTIIGHRREITSYTTQQIMPVAQEGISKMAPTVGNAAKEIAKGIKEGINEADKKE